MRNLLNIICITALLTFPALSSAQSLMEIMGDSNSLPQPQPKADATQQSGSTIPKNAMSVARLPDVKLNDNVISKTVLKYEDFPQLKNADDAYTKGDINTALADYLQFANNESENLEARNQALLNSSIIYLQRKEYKKALQQADSALKLNPNLTFAQLLKVWIYAAEGKVKETKKESEKLLFLTADFEYLSSSKLAMAQAYLNADKGKAAMEILQNLYATNPYIISHAVYLMGRINMSINDIKIANTLFEQSLMHDRNNYMAQKYQAKSQYKLDHYVPAWQSYASLFILDNADKTAKKRLKKLSKHLVAAPENYLFYTKLSEIYTKKPVTSNSQALRVGLFSNYNNILTPIQRFDIMPGTNFTITDELMGEVLSGEAYTPKTIVFDKEHYGVHIQNKWGAADFSTKRPFVISLKQDGYSFLLKEVKADNIFAANLGDKELKGSLMIIPTEKGMHLINYTSLDDVLPALLMSVTRGIKTPAALEAVALALRTAIAWELNNNTSDLFDMPDNSPKINYGGVNMESRYVKNAAKKAENKVLAHAPENGQTPVLAKAEIYRSCSAISEEGTKNTAQNIEYNFSPVNLFKAMISNPPKDLYSAPADPTLWSAIKWAYLLPLEDIKARLAQKYKIGKLEYFEPAKTTLLGRVETMRFVGSKKTIELPFDEANFILSAGTLRSPFFTFIPFKKDVLVLGTDTGPGKGLCVEGAFGMAQAGKTTEEILKYYYPDLEISETWQIQKSLL